MMSPMEWMGWLIIGAILGWLASIVVQVSRRRTLWMDILIGIIGAVAGGLVFYPTLAGAIPNIWSLWAAFTGSTILLGIFRLLHFAVSRRTTKSLP